MNTQDHMNFEDILDTIMLQEPEPSHEALARRCAEYPEHREALARFFATWAVQKELPKQTIVDEGRVGHRMVSHALNFLYGQDVFQTACAEAAAAPRLCDAIVSNGLSTEEFASKCGFDDSIVAKLDRRLIRLSSIPRNCLHRIGVALGQGVEAIEGMLRDEPIPLHSYKARGRPTVRVEDFLDAVRASDLSEEAKSEWVKAVAAEATVHEET